MYKTWLETLLQGKNWSFLNIMSKEHLLNASVDETKKNLNINISSSEFETFFNLFTTDINKEETIDLIRKPFLKINDKYIFSLSSLYFRDIFFILTMNIFNSSENILKDTYTTFIANRFENNIANIFELNDYKIKKNYIFNKMEIDLLAYKNGILYIIETKSTYHRHTYKAIAFHTNKTLGDAKEQLIKRRQAIESNRVHFEKLFCIKEIKEIHYLIVTNSFEGKVDRGDSIYKTTDKELMYYFDINSSEMSLISKIKTDYFWEEIKKKGFAEEPEMHPYPFKFGEYKVIHWM